MSINNLDIKVRKLFLLSFVDLVLEKFSKYIGIFILINVLSKDTIGILGIATGYLAFLNYILFAPERILLRDYTHTKKRKRILHESISAYMNFWALKSIVALILGLLLFLFLKNQNLVLGIVFLGLLLQRLLNYFESLIQLVFYVDFKQGLVTVIDLFFNILLILLFTILIFFPTIYIYIFIIVAGEFVICLVWFYLIGKLFNFKYKYNPSWFSHIKYSLFNFTLWYDLGASVMNMLQQIGPVILSFFVSLNIVGDYTIALKIAGLFLIIPLLLQKVGLVHFSNEAADPTNKTLNRYLFIHSFLSLSYIGFFSLFGKALIYYFLTKQNIEFIYQIAMIMLVGIGIYNISRPLVTIAMARLSLRSIFFRVYLPVGILGIVSYFLLAMNFGAFGLAFASIINYSLFLTFTASLTYRLR